MSSTDVHRERAPDLPADMLEYFAAKGKETGGGRGGNANGTAVRRILQVVTDLAGRPLSELRILDLACGEGVYSLEAALGGATVHAVDGRTERMSVGEGFARRLGLSSLRFEQLDLRRVTRASHGAFDVVLFLGILYHLDVPDSFHALENLYALCDRLLVIDTHVALEPNRESTYRGRVYHGVRGKEHDQSDPPEVRQKRLLMSIDNTHSFWFSRESLVRLLLDQGFSSVYECHGPEEPFKRQDRVTLVACKGSPVSIASYPWVNEKSATEIRTLLAAERVYLDREEQRKSRTLKHRARLLVNRVLRPLGCELRRI